MYQSPNSNGSRHQQQKIRSVTRNTSFQNTKGNKKHSHVFMSRLRCMLALLVMTMIVSVLFIFQLAKSSDLFDSNNDAHDSPARKYSIYQQAKRMSSSSPIKDVLEQQKEFQHQAEQAKHLQWQQQQQTDKHYSRYPPKKDQKVEEEVHPKDSNIKKQPPDQHTKLKHNEFFNDNEKPQQQEQPPPKTKHVHKNKNKAKHHRDDAENSPKKISSIKAKNVFLGRNDIAGEQEKQPIALGQERSLAQLSLQEEMDSLNKKPNPSILDDSSAKRGGSAAMAAKGDNDNNEDLDGADPPAGDEQHPNGGNVKINESQQDRMTSAEQTYLHELYKEAVLALQTPTARETTDPLFVTPVDTPLSKLYRIPLEPQVPLGILVDGGRHYFSIKWWKQLIVYLYQLRFTLIQFRLTDDQTFNLQLESYPQLANPVLLEYNAQQKKTYTAQEVRDLVQFAKGYNISMIPEINVPGHAGGWAGIPDLVIMCAEFICNTGYGLPLNIEHPDIKVILKGVLAEVLDIFDNPPYLHLGGDEVNMADPCFEEVGRMPFNYSGFETDLKGILRELQYPESRVIRWERTGQSVTLERAGAIEHFWESMPAVKHPFPKFPNGDPRPWFVSRGLYFDTNHNADCMEIYRNTYSALSYLSNEDFPRPTAIIAGAFELGEEYWRQRNVATRLISVAIGASPVRLTPTKLSPSTGRKKHVQLFNETCLNLGIDGSWCNLQGATATLYKHFMADHEDTWKEWKTGICDRLTVQEMKLRLKSIGSTKKALKDSGFNSFWKNFGEDPLPTPSLPEPNLKAKITGKPLSSLGAHSVPLTGVIFDMVNSMSSSTSEVLELLKTYVAPLGFNLLQLRLVDDFGFAIQLETQPKLGFTALRPSKKGDPPVSIPRSEDYRELVLSAMNDLGIMVVPEVSVSTNAGGWLHSGFVAACPHVLCDKKGKSVTNAIYEPELLAVVYSVLAELKKIFSTSPYIHLGHDNREDASTGCLKEVGMASTITDPMTALSEYEEKLAILAFMIGIEPDYILRWNNQENKQYPDRLGRVTHYKAQDHEPQPKSGEAFFATVDLLSGTPWNVYKRTVALVQLRPKAILGEIRDIGRDTWASKNVGVRLVAFAMGLQTKIDKDLDQKAFKTQVIDNCKASQFEGCDGKVGSKVKNSYKVESDRYSDKLCSEFTYNVMGQAANPQFLREKI